MTVTQLSNPEWSARSESDPSRLHLQLIGETRVYWNGRQLPLPGPKPLAVLAYLHLKGRTSRDEMAEVFWPKKTVGAAQGAAQNVRQALTTLRRLDGSAQWLREDRSEIELAAVSDVSELHRLHGRGDHETALSSASGSGALLGRLSAPSAIFGEWLEEERRRLQETQLQVLYACGVQQLQNGQYDGARSLLQQMLYMDAANEATYRALMLLEHRAGRNAEALEMFEECRRMLENDLDQRPAAETLDLLHQIEDGQPGSNQRGQWIAAGTLPGWNTEPCFGRQEVLERVRGLLERQPVLLHGLAGLGKTRLAQELAGQVAQRGRAVAWLDVGGDPVEVVLANLRDLLRGAGTAGPEAGDLNGALLHADLGLLVLDNAVGTYAAQQVLAQLPEGLPVLVTSRLRLPNLTRVELPPLPREAALALLRFHLPEADAPGAASPSPEAAHQDALCSLLGDHPFALRLAARTLGHAPGSEMVRALYSAPHDTVSALLEQSVSHLDPRAYEAYLGLGSLDVPQATPELLACLLGRPQEQVTGTLLTLLDRGLLTQVSRPGHDTVSFRMHDLTWHAARAHRAHLPPHVIQAVTTYAEEHTGDPDLLGTDLPHLVGAAAAAPPPLLRRLLRAWLGGQYIAARGFPTAHLHLLQRGIEGAEQEGDLETASLLNGKYADVAQALLGDQVTAISRLLRAAGQAGQLQAWGRQATLLALAGQMEAGRNLPDAAAHLQAAQELAERSGDLVTQARVRAQVAVAHALRKEFPQAHTLLSGARDLLGRALTDDPRNRAIWSAYLGVLSHLGQTEMRLGNLVGALELKREVGRLASERDDHLFMARSALDQGELLHQLGHVQEAVGQLRRSLEISQSIGAGGLESQARTLLHNILSAQPDTAQPDSVQPDTGDE